MPLLRRQPDPTRDAPLDERSDDELMRLSRGGANAAFDELVRRHQQRALRIAAKRLGDVASAQDAVQNSFLQIFRALPRYRAAGKFEAYLYRVVLNQCRMTYRARKSRQRDRSDRPAGAPKLVPPPDEEILADEERREVEAALARLGDRHRDVLSLRFGGELSYREIAEVLGVPLGTVKRRIFDGLIKLRKQMAGKR